MEKGRHVGRVNSGRHCRAGESIRLTMYVLDLRFDLLDFSLFNFPAWFVFPCRAFVIRKSIPKCRIGCTLSTAASFSIH